MLTRPNFLPVGRFPFLRNIVFVSLALVLSLLISPDIAQAKRKKKKESSSSFAQVIANKPWPPAIVPDFIEALKRDKLLIANKYGRVSIVDFKNAGHKDNVPSVIAEIATVGKKLASISTYKTDSFALINRKVNSESTIVELVKISTRKQNEPSIVSTQTVGQLKEGRLVLASSNLILIAGLSTSNENIILVIDSKKSKSDNSDLNVLSSITTKLPVTQMDCDGKKLIALGTDGNQSLISFISLTSKSAPQLEKNLDLKGNYYLLSRKKNVLVVAGNDKNGQPEARSVSLRPAPDIVAGTTLNQLEKITAIILLGKEVLVAGTSKEGARLLTLSVDQHGNLLTATEIKREKENKKNSSFNSLVFDGKSLYLSRGWSGIETIKQNKNLWSTSYKYSIPRMGASNMASWGNSAVLVAGDLVKYDLTDPESPRIDARASLNTPIKSMVGAGSYILCLTKDSLLLRKMEKIDENVATQKVEGKGVSFDKEQHRAYVIQPFGKLTRIHPYKVYSDSLDPKPGIDIPGNFTSLKAKDGVLLLSDLNDISLYSVGTEIKKLGHRHFDNYAIRDAWLLDEYIIATAIDQSSKGFLLVLSRKDDGLNILGNTPLPHNGTALSAMGNYVATIGRNDKDRDILTLVDIKNPTQPLEKESLKVIEAASSITMKSKVAIVAGRGIEIFSIE